MKKLLLASTLFATMFANSAMAAPVDYVFSGSNTPQNVETFGTVMGEFTLDGAVATSWSFTMNHDGFSNTYASDDASVSLENFSWTMGALGDITSILFDADMGTEFLYVVWNIAGNANRLNAGAANRYEYGQRVFLDTASVSVSAVPIPAAAFMFAPALLGFMGLRRKAKNSAA